MHWFLQRNFDLNSETPPFGQTNWGRSKDQVDVGTWLFGGQGGGGQVYSKRQQIVFFHTEAQRHKV